MFSSHFTNVDNDPFFSAHREQMRAMNRMMNEPFGYPLGIGAPITHSGPASIHQSGRQLMPLETGFPDLFTGMAGGGLFGHMASLMNGMQRQMQSIQSSPDALCYSQQSMYSYSSDGNGQPKVFEAHSTTRTAPGGVKETKKAVRDSVSGIEKMAIGHHIGERGHIIQKSRDHRTGQIDEEEQLMYMDDVEKAAFDREWHERTRAGDMRDRALRGTRHAVAALPSADRDDLHGGPGNDQSFQRRPRRRHHESSDVNRRQREPL